MSVAVEGGPSSGEDASAREAVATVRAVFAAFCRYDAPGMAAHCTDDVVFRPVTAKLARGGRPYEGREGVFEYVRDARAVWEELRPEPRHFTVMGDTVIATGTLYAWGQGRVFDHAASWTFHLRDGLVSEVTVHGTAGAARAHVGRLPA
ncbi:nuclear transport factor 2 family protein [Conexibacter sp. SYSU D00693]|uniref:nuclear transport factor 2 family protein n=1 Tax=Conexibacter sp. SYSU D00693 TaxID=2812560 RepID=UPI00196A271B|nr:nuclear transport factor 2 family protein [Conexibacter sp. SYSU D00693]